MNRTSYYGMPIIGKGITDGYPCVVTGYMRGKRLAAKIMFAKVGVHNYYNLWKIFSAKDELMWTWETKKCNFPNVKNISPYFGYLNKEPYICVLNRAAELPRILSIIPLFYVHCFASDCSEKELKEVAVDFAKQNHMVFNPSQAVLHIEEIMCSASDGAIEKEKIKQAKLRKKKIRIEKGDKQRKYSTRKRDNNRRVISSR